MKKFNLFAILLLLFVACQKEDDTLVPAEELQFEITETQLSDTSLRLEWNDLNASNYIVEYAVQGHAIEEGLQVSTTTPSIVLSNLLPETTYEYRISAVFQDNVTRIISSTQSFTTIISFVSTQFEQNLSEMRLFKGNLGNLIPSPQTFKYDLNTTLYTDHALKQRIVALPPGTSMEYNGDGLPNFPDNTVIAKTFYYNVDDRDLSLGKQLIETRVMIKMNGVWEFGNYVWNESQTDAVLDNEGSVSPISWIDLDGATQNANYKIPSMADCVMCHQSYGNSTPIGPKLRSMNFNISGINQLQWMINNGHLTNAPSVEAISSLPNWQDTSLPDERRVRAYFDMNCAHCHSDGGYHTYNFYEAMDVAYETPFEDSQIYDKRYSILTRIQSSIEEYSMPFIGITFPHQEALDLIVPYLESLEEQ